MKLLITILAIFIFLILNEIYFRISKEHSENNRKLVHIVVGSFAALWPFFLSWTYIEFLSIAFFVTILLSKKFNIFSSIHSVKRITWGEAYFAVAIGLVAVITDNKWIFMASILQLSFADGLAAVMGSRYGKKNSYKVVGQNKSFVGSITFFIISLLIFAVYITTAPMVEWSAIFIAISFVLTLFENISVYGLDNLIVPLVTALVLKSL
jgi:phytol kinase